MPRIGRWVQTFTGRAAWPLDLRPEDVCIDDVAHALALQCRFAGHCREPYSVAEHSVRVARVVDGHPLLDAGSYRYRFEMTLRALLHDAAEAYVVDLPRPVKLDRALAGYREIEKDVDRVVVNALMTTICVHDYSIIREADDILLATEARDLMAAPPMDWHLAQPPLEEKIVPWPWDVAEAQFLDMYRKLKFALDAEQKEHG